ncbi:hypothetical protein K438DRAFT_1873797 [Mycena galopus ATCC 62051]|nr:hypothetical protein K438DRAFT_1873797 [Mycena galopus ATCC 62051]
MSVSLSTNLPLLLLRLASQLGSRRQASISPQISLATPAVRVAGPLTVSRYSEADNRYRSLKQRLRMRCRTTMTRTTSAEAAGCSHGL